MQDSRRTYPRVQCVACQFPVAQRPFVLHDSRHQEIYALDWQAPLPSNVDLA